MGNKEESYAQRLNDREVEVSDLKNTLSGLQSEYNEVRQFEEVRNSDNQKLIHDIQTITKENQFLKESLKSASEERDFYKGENDRASGDSKHMQ